MLRSSNFLRGFFDGLGHFAKKDVQQSKNGVNGPKTLSPRCDPPSIFTLFLLDLCADNLSFFPSGKRKAPQSLYPKTLPFALMGKMKTVVAREKHLLGLSMHKVTTERRLEMKARSLPEAKIMILVFKLLVLVRYSN